MLTLSILRHAKSNWDDPDLSDYERPLSKRGTKAAADMGRHITQKGARPDLVISSDAVRARATVSLILNELDAPPPEVAYDEKLYLAPAPALLERVRRVKQGPAHVMLVGHNPGLHALALSLTGSGDRKTLQRLAMKFPTGALAVISFAADDWNAVAPASGTLEAFITPRELA